MKNDLNIIEAYLKEFGQMIILLIGMPTSNKSNIAKELGSDIEPKFTLINLNNYFEKKFVNIKTKNINFKIYDHPDHLNYSKLFDDINKVKSNGIILYGNFIDFNKIKDIKIDFGYFFDIKPTFLKNNLIKKKKLPFLTNQNNIDTTNNTETTTDDTTTTTDEKETTTTDEKETTTDEKETTTTDDTTTTTDEKETTTDEKETTTDKKETTTDKKETTTDKKETTTDKKETTTDEKELNSNNEINYKLEIYIKDILIPMYDTIKKNIKFNKFYNIKEDTKFSDIYDNLFDNLILLIKKKLNQPITTDS